MTVQSIYTDHKFDLVTVDERVYAPIKFEHMFDTLGSEDIHVAQKQADPAPPLLTAQSSRGADSPASREDMFAVKTAQLVATYLTESARAEMTRLGTEFSLDGFVRQTARLVAAATAPTLQPLSAARRSEVAARTVDPADTGEDLDLVLDGIGRVLGRYCDYLPTPRWVPLASDPSDAADLRVMKWRGPDGSVVLDLLDTLGPDQSPEQHHWTEIKDVLDIGRRQFGVAFAAVRYLPTYVMSRARVYYPDGNWDPYLAVPVTMTRHAA